MAVNTNLTMEYYLQQDKSSNPRKSGKWYGKIRKRHGLNLDGLCKHIASHGSLYTEDVVTGVMKKAKGCIIELVSTGAPVKIDGLGTFYPSMTSRGAESEDKYEVQKHIKGIRLRFLPEGGKDPEMSLNSKMFLKRVRLQRVARYEQPEEEGGEG